MCGIFGVVSTNNRFIRNHQIPTIAKNLFTFSQTRGSEAAGIAINNFKNVDIFKKPSSPAEFIKSDIYNNILKSSLEFFINNNLKTDIQQKDLCFSFIGHTRLVTNGSQSQEHNNQPVRVPGMTMVHNGIITNEDEIIAKNKDIKKDSDLDSELLAKLIVKNNSLNNNIKESLIKSYSLIKGSASIAAFTDNSPYLLLATNTGSLFYFRDIDNGLLIFASERFILNKLLLKNKELRFLKKPKINQINSNSSAIVNLNNFEIDFFNFKDDLLFNFQNKKNIHPIFIKDNTSDSRNIKRCSKCILPVTYPYMDLDSKGVCRYCRNHTKFSFKGEKVLFQEVDKYRSNDGSPDCIVAVSGGRDSCYGLHYIKKVLGMNPIAFTYDWGLVTDLARRNTARVCGALGIEHIYRTPDISLKRRNVRMNVEAWLKKPELGMIPLFMAGDKAFYYHARQLRKETGIKLVIFCTGNDMEHTPFKFGFSGVKGGESGNTLTGISVKDKIGLLTYYLKNFIRNPSYLNRSLIDTSLAYFHTFVTKDDFLYLFRYLQWNEDEVVNTIIREYDWEISPDTNTTWRIGDATASFYNYIYSTTAGFTENDDMLSNFVREGLIKREEALLKSIDFSRPRYNSIIEYCQMIGVNYEDTLARINRIKKLY